MTWFNILVRLCTSNSFPWEETSRLSAFYPLLLAQGCRGKETFGVYDTGWGGGDGSLGSVLGAPGSRAPPCVPLGAACSAPPLSSRPSLVLFLLCSVPHSGRHALAVGTTMVVADPTGCTLCSSDLGASPLPPQSAPATPSSPISGPLLWSPVVLRVQGGASGPQSVREEP